MAFHLLERNRDGARRLANILIEALDAIGHCKRCRNISETELCRICVNEKRDPSVLCVVETPADVKSIEAAADYRGRYFVLMGHLSPLDGIGPEQLELERLKRMVMEGEIREVILATGTTAEGQATTHYIAELLQSITGVRVTRLAYGIPLGGDLEYVDSGTLSHAIASRREI
jgi:recombination protein RecR